MASAPSGSATVKETVWNNKNSIKFGWLYIAEFEWIICGCIFQSKMYYSHWKLQHYKWTPQ